MIPHHDNVWGLSEGLSNEDLLEVPPTDIATSLTGFITAFFTCFSVSLDWSQERASYKPSPVVAQVAWISAHTREPVDDL